MSDNQPYDPSQTPPQPPSQPNPPGDWREQRREEREAWREERRAWRDERRAGRQGGAWIWGVFLILLGIGFLLDNMGIYKFENWWALFILIPAAGAFQSAFGSYRSAGNRLTAEARGQMIGGFILSIVAFIFLFGFQFGTLWPVLLVIAGLGLLINALLPG